MRTSIPTVSLMAVFTAGIAVGISFLSRPQAASLAAYRATTERFSA